MFTGFLLVALQESLAGHQSCDCFGTVPVKPYYSAILDLLLASASFASYIFLRDRAIKASYEDAVSIGLLSFIFVLSSLGILYAREVSNLSTVMGETRVVGLLQLNGTSVNPDTANGELLLATRGSGSIELVGFEKNCSVDLDIKCPVYLESAAVTRIPIAVRRPPDGAVELVPLTILLNDRGALRQVRLNLRASSHVL
jgi:hypothetical protein